MKLRPSSSLRYDAVGVLERHTAAELTAPPLQVLPQI